MAGRGLRVIGGSARGIELRAPKGGGTRPTTGRLREALFAMLEATDASFDEVLDLYAGSGALGIEALSRGDGRATFVESDRRATDLIRANLEHTRFTARATVWTARVGRWRPPADARYTLVLADPPYEVAPAGARGAPYHGAANAATPVAEASSEVGSVEVGAWRDIQATIHGHLEDGAIVVVEHDARHAAPPSLAGLEHWRERRHGAGAVALYR